MTVPLGLVLLDEPATADGFADLGKIAAHAEAAGADAVWLTDHIYWHRPTVDVISGLAAVAAATERATIGPCVLQLPLRDIASTAKSLAYLSHLAPSRLVAGVGIGEHEAEYIAVGKGDRYHRRGLLLDEGIGELRAAWAHGGHGLAMRPGGPVPIWVGGRSEQARRRAATIGDGWIPHLCRSPWFAEQMALLADDLDRAGRPGDAIARSAAVAVSVDGIEPEVDPLAWLGELYALPPKVFSRALIRGSAEQIAAEIQAFADAGAGQVTLVVAGDQPVAHLAAVRGALNG